MKHPPPNPNGIAAEHWQGAAQGRLVLPRCSGCGRFHWPPRAHCPECRSPLAWHEASGRGSVASFSIVRRAVNEALAGDAPKALHMLAGLRGEGEAVVPMLSWITSQVQALALLSAVQESGGNLAQAFNQARVWDSKQPLFRRALQRGSAAHFEKLLSDCARIDRISKGRLAGDAWRELERVIVGIGAPRALR